MADFITLEGGLRVRHGVGMIILNPEGLPLVGLRTGTNVWQLPQGGREFDDEGLLPAEAAREMREELGIMPPQVKYAATLPQTTDYELPEHMRGRGFDAQRHHWMVYEYLTPGIPDLSKATDKELDELAWRDFGWLLQNTSDFRLGVYTRVVEMLETERRRGF